MTNHIMTLGIMSPKASCSQVQVSCVLKGSFVNYAFSDGVIVAHSQEFHLLRFVWMCIYTFCTKVQAFSLGPLMEIGCRVYENTTGYLKNHWTKHILYSFWWCISYMIHADFKYGHRIEQVWILLKFSNQKVWCLHMTVA